MSAQAPLSAEAVLGKFRSCERDQIYDATWAIVASFDRAELAKLSAHVPEMLELIARTELGGGVYSNADNARFACAYAEGVAKGECRCAFYRRHPTFNPEREVEAGYVELLAPKRDDVPYEEHYDVRCRACGTGYLAQTIHGWHVPWYKWTAR
jgi:hypothetical protein